MAAGEARAAWQRTANRYFVQEDAKRAPKLACCQSSSSSSKLVDCGPTNPTDGPDYPSTGFMPLNKNSLYSNLPANTRWWVQMQPNHGYQNGLIHDQLKAIESKNETSKLSSESSTFVALDDGQVGKSDSICTDDHNKDDSKREVKPIYSPVLQEFVEVVGVKENYELTSKDTSEFEIDFDSPWIRIEKNLPWWRTTDIDEIATLVSQRTYECIENCDLPPTRKLCMRKRLNAEHMARPLASKFHLSSKTGSISGGQECIDIVVTPSKQGTVEGNFGNCSEKSFSDTSKAELMEALRHSQTRAREAEKAAKQANAEKEHIIQLFFKQTSQLFACRQWLQLLQFDQAFSIQMKKNSQPFSSLFPLTLPWMSCNGRKKRKNLQRLRRRRRAKPCGQPRHGISKYAAALALGLSLIGAGLLLGWTVGWMFPPF